MHERAELLNGHLEIHSEPGVGTRVCLEAVRTDDLRPTATDQVVRILLVEDHADVREEIAAELAAEADFEIVGQAATLARAREMLEDVDVAIVDLGLPDGYGLDLIEELRAASPRAHAIVVSGFVEPVEAARAVERGADAVLDKVAHLGHLAETVRGLRASERPEGAEEVDG
jgi:DNA-binding NarL/FixJ family response regulator